MKGTLQLSYFTGEIRWSSKWWQQPKCCDTGATGYYRNAHKNTNGRWAGAGWETGVLEELIRGGKRGQVVFSRVTEVEEGGRAVPAGGEHRPGTREEPQGPRWQKKSACGHWDKVQSQAGSFQKDLGGQAEVFSGHPMGNWGDRIPAAMRWTGIERAKPAPEGDTGVGLGVGRGHLQATELSGSLTTVQYSGCSSPSRNVSLDPTLPTAEKAGEEEKRDHGVRRKDAILKDTGNKLQANFWKSSGTLGFRRIKRNHKGKY